MHAIRFGVHLSLGKTPGESLKQARDRGADSIQVFASSPGAWKPPVHDTPRYREIRDAGTRLDISPVVIHAIYLINLASEDPVLRSRSRASLVATLNAARELGASTVTTHIGSHSGRGFDEVASVVAEGILEVLERTPNAPDLALENSAGTGNIIGSTFQELRKLLDLCGRPERLKVTLDTAHLCGAGWDFTEPTAAMELSLAVEQEIGRDRLALLHANDSRMPPGSKRDRHEVVGEGFIGDDGFRHLLSQPSLRRAPWILETPDLGDKEPDQQYRSLRRIIELDREIRRLASVASSPCDADYDADAAQTPSDST